MTFAETLADWMPTQRWFAGKGARILDVAIVADTELAAGDPGLRHLIIDVSQGSSVDSYQVFVGLRKRIPHRLDHAVIGKVGDDVAFAAAADGAVARTADGVTSKAGGAARGGLTAYDALHDPDLTKLLLRAIATGGQVR